MGKKTAFAAVALVGGCLVSLLVGEIFLTVSNVWIGRHSDTMFTIIEHDQMLGWRMKRNISEKIDLVDVEDIPVRSNSGGFRDREFALQKPVDRCRIAFLGDSFTWGFGVYEEERFTNLVVAANQRWESLNFAVPGYGTDQSLLLWKHMAHRYRPDVAVLTIYQNDYLDNMYLVRYGRRKPYFELKEEGTLELRNVPVEPNDFWDDGIFNQAAPGYASFFQNPIQKRSRVIHWLAKNSGVARFSYTVFRANDMPWEVREKPKKSDEQRSAMVKTPSNESELPPAEQIQVRLLGALVKQLAEQVEANGGRLIVVLSGDPVPQYELQKKAFTSAGIPHLDATTAVLSTRLAGSGHQVYYPYSKHWTPSAHRAVADLLAKNIRNMGLCGEERKGTLAS